MNEAYIRSSLALPGKMKVCLFSDTLEGLEREAERLRLKYLHLKLGEPVRAPSNRWAQFGTAWN